MTVTLALEEIPLDSQRALDIGQALETEGVATPLDSPAGLCPLTVVPTDSRAAPHLEIEQILEGEFANTTLTLPTDQPLDLGSTR